MGLFNKIKNIFTNKQETVKNYDKELEKEL